MESWKKLDPTATIPPPEGHIPRQIYDIVTNFWFDTTVNCLIVINMIPISLELTSDEDDPNFIVLRVLNYIFCFIYVSEAVLKVGFASSAVIIFCYSDRCIGCARFLR